MLYYELSPRAGAVVQLGERFPCTEEVAGSNPVSSTMNILWDKPDLSISCYENVLPPDMFQEVLLYSQDISRYEFRDSYLQNHPVTDEDFLMYESLIQHHREAFPFLKDCEPQTSNFLRYQDGHSMHPHNDMSNNDRKFTTCLYLTSNDNNPLRFVNTNNVFEQVFNYYNVENQLIVFHKDNGDTEHGLETIKNLEHDRILFRVYWI